MPSVFLFGPYTHVSDPPVQPGKSAETWFTPWPFEASVITATAYPFAWLGPPAGVSREIGGLDRQILSGDGGKFVVTSISMEFVNRGAIPASGWSR